ncbi:hypothetical protein VNO77_24185 [Canavalia gladiata]|uniref:Uncharacterized protein n=1 Tax=Canavalia gladiata TaxID=3824 RepID=A0AAN9L6K1_CANGL
MPFCFLLSLIPQGIECKKHPKMPNSNKIHTIVPGNEGQVNLLKYGIDAFKLVSQLRFQAMRAIDSEDREWSSFLLLRLSFSLLTNSYGLTQNSLSVSLSLLVG